VTDHPFITDNEIQTAATDELTVASVIVISPSGSDTLGVGTFANPYKTLTKAFAVATALRPTIFMLPGEYAEAAMVVWPNISGLSVIGMGDVSISNAGAGAAVIDVHPTYTASTMSITLNGVNIAAEEQIGLRVDNAHMTKKLNIYLDGVSFEMDTSGDSVDVVDTVTTQAIRIYARNCSFEGLVHVTGGNAGERYRFTNCDFIGGLTTATAVAYEVTLVGCTMLTSGITVDVANQLTNVGCVYRTDADPAVYTEFANAYAT